MDSKTRAVEAMRFLSLSMFAGSLLVPEEHGHREGLALLLMGPLGPLCGPFAFGWYANPLWVVSNLLLRKRSPRLVVVATATSVVLAATYEICRRGACSGPYCDVALTPLQRCYVLWLSAHVCMLLAAILRLRPRPTEPADESALLL